MNNDNATCSECGGSAELEYYDDGKGVAYAHCMEQCWECCICNSIGNIGEGNDAQPLEDGRCCDYCYDNYVVEQIMHDYEVVADGI